MTGGIGGMVFGNVALDGGLVNEKRQDRGSA